MRKVIVSLTVDDTRRMYVKVVNGNDFSEKEVFKRMLHNMIDHLVDNDFSVNEHGLLED